MIKPAIVLWFNPNTMTSYIKVYKIYLNAPGYYSFNQYGHYVIGIWTDEGGYFKKMW